jgi:TolB-like protein/Tfp pilus assembly protein PilF
MTKLKELLAELKARNVRKTLAIYLGSALTTIGIIKLFAETYGLSTSFMPIVVTVLTCGLVSAFVFAWFHGKEGAQKFSRREVLLHAGIAIVALLLSLRIGPASTQRSLPKSANTIAVLPFKNMSDHKEDEYFSDGITEDILTQLAKIHDLNVISRTSVMKYKNAERNLREIADELGVTAVLEGSVRRAGDRVRITGQLIAAREDRHIWAETFDREMKDIFAIQTEVAQTIARELKARLSPEEQNRLRAEPTNNIEAYSLFLRARELQNKRTLEANAKAVELIRRALSLDSTYAAAYALLGMAHISRYLAFGFSAASADSGIAYAQKAIALDRNIPDGFHALGKGYEATGKLSLALEQYNKAIALSPSYAPAFASVGFIEFGFGRLDEALQWMRKSVMLTPDVATRYVNVGSMYDFLGEDSLALYWYHRALTLQENLITAHWSLVYHYLNQGAFEKARHYAAKALGESPHDVSLLHARGDIELLSGNLKGAYEYYRKSVDGSSYHDGPGNQLAFTLMKLGKTDEAKAILESNLAYFTMQSQRFPEDAYNAVAVATIHAIRNEVDEAVAILRLAVRKGWRDYRWAKIEPMYASLRSDVRFQELMADLDTRIEAMRRRAEERGLLN